MYQSKEKYKIDNDFHITTSEQAETVGKTGGSKLSDIGESQNIMSK